MLRLGGLAVPIAIIIGLAKGGLLGALTALVVTMGVVGGIAILRGEEGIGLDEAAQGRGAQRFGGLVATIGCAAGGVAGGWKWGWLWALCAYGLGMVVAAGIGWLGGRRRSATELAAGGGPRAETSDDLVTRYATLLEGDSAALVRSESSLPASKGAIKDALIRGAVAFHKEGKPEAVEAYRAAYMQLGLFVGAKADQGNEEFLEIGHRIRSGAGVSHEEVRRAAQLIGDLYRDGGALDDSVAQMEQLKGEFDSALAARVAK